LIEIANGQRAKYTEFLIKEENIPKNYVRNTVYKSTNSLQTLRGCKTLTLYPKYAENTELVHRQYLSKNKIIIMIII
jgi:hypothetical protein